MHSTYFTEEEAKEIDKLAQHFLEQSNIRRALEHAFDRGRRSMQKEYQLKLKVLYDMHTNGELNTTERRD